MTLDPAMFAMISVLVMLLVIAAYQIGRTRAIQVPRGGYRSPTLREIVVTAKFSVPATTTEEVCRRLLETLNPSPIAPFWTGTVKGNFIELQYRRPEKVRELVEQPLLNWHWRKTSPLKQHQHTLFESRAGIPMGVQMLGNPSGTGKIDFDVTVLPVLYYRVTQYHLMECTPQQIEEAQHECSSFVNELRGILGGDELQSPQVTASGPATDVRRKLVQFGLNSQADLLTQAETKIMAGQIDDGVKNCRSAIEQIAEKLMIRHRLRPTNAFANNISSLESNKYLDPQIGEFIRKGLYTVLSGVAHDKYAPGPKVAKYILATTEETIGFLLDRMS